MNILHLVEAERLKKSKIPNPEFEKLEEQAKQKNKGQKPIVFSKEELRKRLTPIQYSVTQEMTTEKLLSSILVTCAFLYVTFTFTFIIIYSDKTIIVKFANAIMICCGKTFVIHLGNSIIVHFDIANYYT